MPIAASISRHGRLVFLVMLVVLHVALMRKMNDAYTRAMMVAEVGLFILWQPFMRGEYHLKLAQLGAIFAAGAAMLVLFNWWIAVAWIVGLTAVVGGKVFLYQSRWLRWFYLIGLFYLLAILLVWVVPHAANRPIASNVLDHVVTYALPVLLVIMLFLPARSERGDEERVIDFFHALLLFLLLVVLVLGSLAFVTIGSVEYLSAVTYTVLLIATALLLLSWAWNPGARFGGLSALFSRYLLSIGLPYEQWLNFLADLSQQEADPERFMQQAFSGMARLPWVAGGRWRASAGSGDFGGESDFRAEFTSPRVSIELYTERQLSPALIWHFNILVQLLGEFYVAKQREQKLQKNSYVQAIHETGARLTHDIKNLLQSLNSLCSVVIQEDVAPSAELHALVRRQLPVIAKRLQATLDKLRKPQTESGQFILASVWWRNLQRLHQDSVVQFETAAIEVDCPLPQGLFDSVAENLLQNALAKRKLEPQVEVRASLRCTDRIELRVSDTGHPVEERIARELLQAPVESRTGLGIGLYQAARQAETAGFKLVLESRGSPVCFMLTGVLQANSKNNT
jgi:signal transduction histidine kinase